MRNTQMNKLLITLSLLALLSGCTHYQIGTAMSEYDKASQKVNLGDSKKQVLETLNPTQKTLTRKQIKQPDKYLKDDVLVEIYYFRSGWQSDGLTTDDEFTPYIFNNGQLVGVGWQLLGGAKSQGQTSPTTNVNVQQNTVVY